MGSRPAYRTVQRTRSIVRPPGSTSATTWLPGGGRIWRPPSASPAGFLSRISRLPAIDPLTVTPSRLRSAGLSGSIDSNIPPTNNIRTEEHHLEPDFVHPCKLQLLPD